MSMQRMYATITCLLMLLPAQAAVVGPESGPVNGVEPATVMEVNPAGVGHINLVPYFSVHSNFATHIHLINTDTYNGKAVKVRFRTASDGEDIANFTLLLGPGDGWAGALVYDAATNYPRLIHNDRSCTLPAVVAGMMGPFYLPDALGGKPEAPLLTHEGSVEVITLADIPPPGNGQSSPLFAAVTEGAITPGGGCAPAALAPLADDSTSYADARSKGLDVPTSGLMTHWTLINVPHAVGYAGRATAIEARTALDGAPAYGNVVLFPQTEDLVTGSRVIDYTTSLLVWGRGYPDGQRGRDFGYLEHQLPDLSTPYLLPGLMAELSLGTAPRRQAYAISQALAISSIGGELLTEPSIAAETDWVLTLPTRHLQAISGADAGTTINLPAVVDFTVDRAGIAIGGGIRNFFYMDQDGGNVNALGGTQVCIGGMDPTSNGVPSASPSHSETTFRSLEGKAFAMQLETAASRFALCGHTSIIRFANPGDTDGHGTLGEARYVRRLTTPVSGGWGRIQTPGNNGIGLPLIGFAAVELYNGSVAPVVSGVGLTYPLTTTKP